MSNENPISHRFWFEHETGVRLYPYRLLDRTTGRQYFQVTPDAKGPEQNKSQIQLDSEDEVFDHVFHKGWSVRMCSMDRSLRGLYNKESPSIVRTSKF